MTKECDNRFYHYAIRYLREEFPEKTSSLTEEQVKDLIDKGLTAAHANHFSTEADAMAFIDIDLRLEGVLSDDEQPRWVKKILEDVTLTVEQKLYLLRDAYCTFEWVEQNS